MENIQILLYFGCLMLIGALATVAALIVARREQADKHRHKRLRKRPEDEAPPPTRQAQVQLIWAGEDMPLIWQVEGRSYAHPDSITDPQHRAAMEQFMKKVGQTLPALLAPRPVPATVAPSPEVLIVPVTAVEESLEQATVEPVEEALPIKVEEAEPEAMPPAAEAAEVEETRAVEPSDPSGDTPVVPPPARKAPRTRTYDEMMELPFLERLKASFFGPPAPTVAEQLDQAELQPIPTLKVDDLNTILQRRLMLLADAPPASIRPTPQGLLEIIVDGKIYERIDDVPHEQVRETMREAVRIWEKSIE